LQECNKDFSKVKSLNELGLWQHLDVVIDFLNNVVTDTFRCCHWHWRSQTEQTLPYFTMHHNAVASKLFHKSFQKIFGGTEIKNCW